MKTQEQRIVEQLEKNGEVNNFWAVRNYILRLGARIADLRSKGWNIEGHFGEGKERKNFIYRLVSKP